MLSSLKFLDPTEVDKSLEKEKKARRKAKKQRHKEKKQAKKESRGRDAAVRECDSGASSSGEELDASPQGAAICSEASREASPVQPVAREDWMTKAGSRPLAEAKPDAEAQAEAAAAARAAKMQEREINKERTGVEATTSQPAQPASGLGAAPAAGVGDSGASWRLKALRRAQAQAAEQGADVKQVVEERWGSLSALTAGLTAGRAAHAMAHRHAAAERAPEGLRRPRGGADGESGRGRGGNERGEEGGRGRGRGGSERGGEDGERGRGRGGSERGEEGRQSEGRGHEGSERGEEGAHYLRDVQSTRSQMRRPTDKDSLSWRSRRPGGKRSERSVPPAEQRSSPPGERDSSAADTAHPSISQHGGEPSSGGKQGEPSSDGNKGDSRGERRPDGRSEHRSERGGEDRPDRRSAHRSGRGVERSSDSRNEHKSDRRPAHRDPLGRQADAAILRGAAASLNQFSGDGSFLERFQQQAIGAAAADATGAPNGRASPRRSRSPVGTRNNGGAEEMQLDNGSSQSDGERDSDPGALQARLQSSEGGGATSAASSGSGGGGGGGGRSNVATAAALRARLLGKAPPAEPAGLAGAPASSGGRAERVVLPMVDASGRAMPGAFGREAAGAGAPDGGRKPKRVQRYGEGGVKERYFADDEKQDLTTLVKRQRYEGAEDIDANLADNIARSARYKGKELDVDDEYDVDGGLEMYESRKRKGTKEQQAQRSKRAQVSDYMRTSSILDNCARCFASARRPRHLTISIGQTAYLMLPERGRLVPGHCCIVPSEHVASSRLVDEHVWTEMRNFKKCLLQMFMAQGKEVIFLETAMQLGDARNHAVVECIPVPPAVAAKAPLFFKKGIDDAESEWSQHHAKRLIDTRAKGLRGSIPPNFPYFHVEFGLTAGYVHVIDDETKFKRDFGRSIMVGLLRLPDEDMHRQAKQESPALQQQRVVEFAKQWDPYDWTKQLG
ncbi:hypothetical protein WJX72_002672 [[Myrmecia] bisecta]|uniref:CWF19-like protein 2 n=1 Tax=[Myrmecia] bisecta TaxID=41462 RepID=A0AAW1QPL5_9CHLO